MANCGCGSVTYYNANPCSSDPCNQCGDTYDCSGAPCPIQLDTTCVIYHKFNNEVSSLTNLNISNGATLELILSVIDGYIAQLKVQTFSLACLRETYVVNTLKQFLEAVDIELCNIKESITDLGAPSANRDWLGNLTSDPSAAINGNYWFNTNQNKLKIKVNGIVKEIVTV